MSGGSWDYSYRRVQDIAEKLSEEICPERRALGALLEKVAEALHDIEWVDSSDMSPGYEAAAIRAVFESVGAVPDKIALEILRLDAQALIRQMDMYMARISSMQLRDITEGV